MMRLFPLCFMATAALMVTIGDVSAQNCKRNGNAVTCDDGRTGVFTGDGIVWPDGTKSSAASQHPSVIIGNKSSIQVGPGVFVGSQSGKGVVPLDNPNSPNKRNCAILDGIPYCH